MNSPKNNIRSFRYSDEIANILEQQKGSNLNEKFNNLIIFSFLRAKQFQDQIDDLTSRRDAIAKELYDLQDKSRALRHLKTNIDEAEKAIKYIEDMAKRIAVFEEK